MGKNQFFLVVWECRCLCAEGIHADTHTLNAWKKILTLFDPSYGIHSYVNGILLRNQAGSDGTCPEPAGRSPHSDGGARREGCEKKC